MAGGQCDFWGTQSRHDMDPIAAGWCSAAMMAVAATATAAYRTQRWAVLVVAAQLAHVVQPDSVQLLPDNDAAGRKVTLELQLNTTHLGVVEVVTFEQHEAPAIRFLRCGSSIVGADFIADEFRGQSAFRNFAILQTVGWMGKDGRKLRVLQLGLGAGTVPNYLRSEHGALVDVVEINPDIVQAAAQHFEYARDPSREVGTTYIQDALTFLEGQPQSDALKYDVVVHDLFTGHNPLLLLERSLLQSIKDRWLTDRGLLVVDFFGYQHAGVNASLRNEHGHEHSVAVQATLESIFGPPPRVRCFRELDVVLYPDKPANLIFMAWAGDPPAMGAPPFDFPTDTAGFPDSMESDGSVYWVQRHFHEFEITEQLRLPSSVGFPHGLVIDQERASAAEPDERFRDDYRDLLESFFPPAADWFPSALPPGDATASAEEL